MNYESMSFEEIAAIYRTDPAVRLKTLEAFEWFASMDPVKALNDLENIKFILEKRLKREAA